MARYQSILAYDGTDFSGFQRQAGRKSNRTIQGEVERALRVIGWQGKSILAAGRTDAGVHASGQVIAFDLDWSHTDQDLQAALNANLPADAALHALTLARPEFHPRFDAVARRYRYRVFCQPWRDPLRERYAWRVWPECDLQLLNQAAARIVGEHDFGAFGSPTRSGGGTTRTVSKADWSIEGDERTFEVTANSFLFRMVRRLVSLMVRIGQGAVQLETINSCLQGRQKDLVKGVAPACGLTLVEVSYAIPAD